ncbi:ARM REPEAT PROTEIN INTERACTING WITH ABF2-like isoform X7 [Camellia sinensis]|uniref:ARM REPEAT PROTEIN INTERACTING WITH ABF2-like isoform X7 n=1 Tax=Camellia sinensis TaxID=4442 RepID=UPI0010362C7B|nr:ARM REPEAT PROTEIN INTERACTING WITH ABF2-like isoform X7 [Camellia sinensis]
MYSLEKCRPLHWVGWHSQDTEKIRGEDSGTGEHFFVLSHLLYLMRIAKKTIQRRIALALANLCSAEDQRTIFIDNNGLELLLGFLGSTNLKQQLDGSIALYKLANKATTLSPIDMAPPSLTPQVCVLFIVSLFGPCVLLDLELFQTISRTSIW